MKHLLFVFCTFFVLRSATAQTATAYWTATPQRNGQLVLTHNSEKLTLQPFFQLLVRPDEPDLRLPRALHLASELPAWKRPDGRGRTFDIYQAVKPIPFRLTDTKIAGELVNWTFAPLPGGTLTAQLNLTEAIPVVRWSFRAAADGYHAVTFAPFAPVPVAEVASLYQPLIWTERRMPDSCYVSAEFMATLPMTLAEQKGTSFGVSAHPSEIPYRMPNMNNSRFAVLLRNATGQAQPTLMAPFFGRTGTKNKAGDEQTFTASVLAVNGSSERAYQAVAQGLFGFADYRQNGTCSLNETIQNMTRFALDDYQAQWSAELRGSNYVTDVAGTIKNVSALHPLSVAILTDNEALFRRRALPMTEYLLSREKYLFTLYDGEENQNPSHFLRGPAAEVSELAALHTYSKGNSPVFKHYALDLSTKTRRLNLMLASEGNSWWNQLALYRMTGQTDYLEKAKTGALAYIEKRVKMRQVDFSDAHLSGVQGGQFWTDFTPKWMELLELYEETGGPNGGDKRFLDAARYGAAHYAMITWMYPVVPPGLTTVHPGDSIRMYYQNRNLSPRPRPFPVREQRVPAWRVSNVGLTSESSYTFRQNPAVLLAHYAAYMLRIGQYANDPYLKAIARSAVVGRYANYPGYDINQEFTTHNQQADYPLHDVNEMTYNQLYYNHIWPHIALLYDYLITDVEVKSAGAVRFPSQYAQGYAYLQSKVYGASPGQFYGDQNVSVWMPGDLLKTDNIQINHLTGHGNGNFYVTLTNQSPTAQTVSVQFNPDLLPYHADETYAVRVIRNNQPAGSMTFRNGSLSLALDGHGIVALVIEKLTIKPAFQHRLMALPELAKSTGFSEQDASQGKITGMLLSWGQNLHQAYIYLTASGKELKETRLHYTLDGKKWQTTTDASYPFEFSISLTDAQRLRGFTYRVETVLLNGKVEKTGELALH